MARNPAAILYDSNGIELAVEDATALPANTRGFVGVGYDGTNTRFIRVDSSGYQVLVGAGTAGTPAGGVVSVQGVSGGQALPVSQGSPPWAVKGTDADGAAVTENPVLVAGWDTTNAQTLLTETDGSVRTKDDFIDDRDKMVGVSFAKLGGTATAYYMGIDLSNTTDFKHAAGTGIRLVQSIGKAFKTNAGAKWSVQLIVVTRIDGTDADLAILAQASLALRDTSKLSIDEQVVNLWPHVVDLTVTAGELSQNLTNAIELNVAAVNTGVLLEDAAGNTVAAAVGDLLIRVELVSGGGTLDFAYGLQYWVE